MAYRNITVDGTMYKYTIGKKFTKVNGVGAILNCDLGAVTDKPYSKMTQGYKNEITLEQFKERSRYLTRPSDVRRFILGDGEVDPQFHDGPHTCQLCSKTSDDVTMRADAFESEIYDKAHYSYCCDECDHESWMNT